ncbi:hypothetical protein TWF281_007726 [Arthrobotrys megalospora]
MKYTNKLHSKNILILGGTSGIGFAVAEATLEHGAKITIASSSASKLSAAIDRLKSAYPEFSQNIRGKTCDLSAADVEDQITALYEYATDNGTNKLDHIANTAGGPLHLTKLADVTSEIAADFAKVRYIGNILLAKHAANYMNKSPDSSFTTTSGVNSAKPAEGWSAIIGVATAVEGLSRALAKDLKPVRVNCVSPGAIKTELFDTMGDEKVVQAIVDLYTGMTLTGRIGQPEEAAESYLYVMKCGFVTGRTIHVDGGYLLV